jgi:O-antigen/teichoic acid export membrane protein
MWLAILIAVIQVGMVFLRTVHKADAGFFWGSVAQYALLLCGVWLWVHGTQTEAIRFDRVLRLTAVSYGICVVIMAILIYRSLYMRLKPITRVKKRTQKWLRVSGSMMGYSVFSMMAPAVILNVVSFMPHILESQTGVFALGLSISSAFGMVPSLTVKGSVMAWMKPLYKTRQKRKLAKLIVYCNWFGMGFNTLFTVMFLLGGHYLIRVLPGDYSSLYWPLVLQAAAYVFAPSINATRSALMMMGKQNGVLVVRIIVIGMLLLFGGLGAYFYGIVGASVAMVGTQFFAALMDAHLLKRIGYRSFRLS